MIFLFIVSNLLSQNEPYDLSLEELLTLKLSIGSRGNLKNIFQSPIPLAVITKEDLENNGFVELQRVIQRILPIFNSPRPTICDGTDHLYPFTLRGFAPDQVLVLINGKRKVTTSLLHINETIGKGSTSNDLNVIPIQAIERIEILKDGASAQYGSDAIAGIINIILKEKTDNTLSYSFSQTHEMMVEPAL
ncbi:MAG TPA: TonB-dependent receptor plug domain-containing protein [Ignavibacteriales bacterium]|nr:TonB-dependent receptor plug domain-containing protein [Ignavibacteriales bacterium]